MSHVSTVANAFLLRLSFAVENEELRNVQCTLQHIPDALLDVLFLEHIPVALSGAQE